MDSEQPSRLADVLDDHLAAEFTTRDVDATMATKTGDPYLNHVPVLTGGIGPEEVRRFYEQIFIGHWPADTTMERISRTAGTEQVVDEASVLVQVGLLNPAGLPVTGAEQADKLLSPRTIPANALLGPHWDNRLTPRRHRPRRKAIPE